MLKIKCSAPATFLELQIKHYEDLNKIVQSGIRKDLYYENSVILKLNMAIQSHTGQTKEVFKFLWGPHGMRLKAILTGSPTLLKLIGDEFYRKFPLVNFYTLNAEGKQIHNEFGKDVIKIFDYKAYRKSAACIENLKLLGIGRRVPCPYCNCEKIDIINYDDIHGNYKNQALLDLDHFLPQSKYPFLAISIFNLIPCCHNCNSNIKGSKDFSLETHIHPYLEAFDDHFSFKLDKPYYDGIDAEELSIKYENKHPSTFPFNSITDLRLMPRYASFVEDIKNMFVKLNSNYYDLIEATLGADLASAAKKNDFAGFGIPTSRVEINKYILGKLKVDLHDEHLGVTTI